MTNGVPRWHASLQHEAPEKTRMKRLNDAKDENGALKFSWVFLKQCQWICLGWFWDFSRLITAKASNPFSRFPRRIRYGSRGSFGTWTGTRTVMRNDIQIQIDSMDSKRWGGPAKWWFQIWKRVFKLDHLLKKGWEQKLSKHHSLLWGISNLDLAHTR